MPICKRCGDVTEKTHRHTKYCNECRVIVNNEFHRRYLKNNRKKMNEYQKNYKKKNGIPTPKKIVCNWCKKLKEVHARDLCVTCYNRWLWINKKVKDMSESEKQDYLCKYNYSNEIKKLTIDDLKKDLGVI